jgi:hypothetical protein
LKYILVLDKYTEERNKEKYLGFIKDKTKFDKYLKEFFNDYYIICDEFHKPFDNDEMKLVI